MLHRRTSDQYAGVSYRQHIFVEFGGRLFQQIVGIPMGTNCAPLLADLFFFFIWIGIPSDTCQKQEDQRSHMI